MAPADEPTDPRTAGAAAAAPAGGYRGAAPGTVLVVGASGLVGAAAVDRFLGEGWDVIAVSRRRPELERRADHERAGRAAVHLPVDLRDGDACAAALGDLPAVTHLVYTAVAEAPGLVAGWRDPEQMALNEAMLHHVLAPLATGSPRLRHIGLLQGTKAYGAHLHRIPVPAREAAPRDPHDNFY